MNVSLKYAEEHLTELLSAADRGEEVRITRPEKPTVKLTLIPTTAPPPTRKGRRILGAGRGELRVPTIDEWQQMDREIEALMCDAPLTSDGNI